uniref:Uncharacterized protein n=1 Tax=Acrobeloides nanus TaxID=290746 RepID=A0A914DNF6_9BILA
MSIAAIFILGAPSLECFTCKDDLASRGLGKDGSCEYGHLKITYCDYNQVCKTSYYNGEVYSRGCEDKDVLSTCFSNTADRSCPCYFDFCNRY